MWNSFWCEIHSCVKPCMELKYASRWSSNVMKSVAIQSKSVQFLSMQFNEMRLNAIDFRDFLLIVVLRSATHKHKYNQGQGSNWGETWEKCNLMKCKDILISCMWGNVLKCNEKHKYNQGLRLRRDYTGSLYEMQCNETHKYNQGLKLRRDYTGSWYEMQCNERHKYNQGQGWIPTEKRM